MASAVERLTKLVDDQNRFDIPIAELLPLQLEAVNERLQEKRKTIKLVGHRAEEGGISEVKEAKDIVPLLFAHTTYKSYPENFLIEEKWDRLGKWLQTVSSHIVPKIDPASVHGLDDWLAKLGDAGHFVSCSSGTTGKCAMMNATEEDIDFASRATNSNFTWATGVQPVNDRRFIATGATANTPRNVRVGQGTYAAFGRRDIEPFAYPGPKVTIGGITEMVVMRKKIAEGTATPGEIAAFEAKGAERQAAIDAAYPLCAEQFIEARKDKLHVAGMLFHLYRIAEIVRSKGYSGKDFNPENTGQIGGGLKGNVLPPNHREYIYETFNLKKENIFHAYGMQELHTAAPKCQAGRYHLAPWIVFLLLDEHGDNLIAPASGEQEGRAAFFDLSLEGRWGGVISGDKVKVTYDTCECGRRGPTINDHIVRYAELAGGDKITCAGTIDAYVRGVA